EAKHPGALESFRAKQKRRKQRRKPVVPKVTPNKGGRPSNDDSPSKQKQKWCYEQYMNHRKKLSQIVVAAQQVFGALAPKSEAEIIIYAQRWADYKSLPFSKRN